MAKEIFSISSISEGVDGKWLVEGRAYDDIRTGCLLSISPEGSPPLRVTGIETYGKRTGLLSKMMTGGLRLQGEIDLKEKAATHLYRAITNLQE